MADQPPPAAYDVLVTGSTGHLGTALMLSLPGLGFHPLGIDILPSPQTTQVGSIADRAFVGGIVDAHPSIRHVIHAATLHQPHLASHGPQAFIDTNITGTQVLLEAAARLGGLQSFVFMSTTSTFGSAMAPPLGQPAAWITEAVVPQPRNVYGATKCCAEDLCQLAHKQAGLPVVVLRTSRFFPEPDGDLTRRALMPPDGLKLNELAYRRLDIADVVAACRCAMARARAIGWGKFVVSASTPFARDDRTLRLLDQDPQKAFEEAVPGATEAMAAKGWGFLDRIDRVYDSSKAVTELGWEPQYTFARAVELIRSGQDWRSELARRVGERGYHGESAGK